MENKTKEAILFLKDQMELKGINQSQLAQLVKTDRSTIKRYFDLQMVPSVEMFIKICNALEVPFYLGESNLLAKNKKRPIKRKKVKR